MKNKRTILLIILLVSLLQLQLGLDLIRRQSVRQIEMAIRHLRLNEDFTYKTLIKDSPVLAEEMELHQEVNS